MPGVPVGGLLVEGGGLLTVTVALDALLRIVGRSEPGEIVSAAVCTTVLAVLVFNPLPHLMSPFPLGGDWMSSTAFWVAAIVVSATFVLAASRDPYLACGRFRHQQAGIPNSAGGVSANEAQSGGSITH